MPRKGKWNGKLFFDPDISHLTDGNGIIGTVDLDDYSMHKPVYAELARRVNGWEEVIWFIRQEADWACVCVPELNRTCSSCKAREVLRKVVE